MTHITSKLPYRLKSLLLGGGLAILVVAVSFLSGFISSLVAIR